MKVLVISNNSFSDVYNNGKTLKALFSFFKKDELCMLFFRPRNEISYSICDKYFLISDKDVLNNIIFPWIKCGIVLNENNVSNNCNDILASKVSRVNQRTKLKQFIREIVWKFGRWDNEKLHNWLQEQKPDAIFLVGSYCHFVDNIAISIHKRLNIPMAVYYTDDYIINSSKSFVHDLTLKSYSKVINECDQFYAIGDEMANQYSTFFDKSFIPIMNLVDVKAITPQNNNEITNISYFGSLYYNRCDAIVSFAKKLILRRDSIKKKYIINIYSSSNIPTKIISLFGDLNIRYKGFVKGDELNKAMLESDIFLHVESDDKEYMKLTSLSVSTKIPEYLMSCRPTIAYGPHELASIKLLESISSELVIISNDSNKQEIAIDNFVELLNSKKKQFELAVKGYNYACEKFCKQKVASDFKRNIMNMINKKNLNN